MDRMRSIGVILFIAGVFLFSGLVPLSFLNLKIPLCIFKWVSEVDCPGCGLTRAFIYFFHGDFRQSIAMNALAPVIILFMVLYGAHHAFILLGKNHHYRWTFQGQRWVSRWFLVLLVGQWVWKGGGQVMGLLGWF